MSNLVGNTLEPKVSPTAVASAAAAGAGGTGLAPVGTSGGGPMGMHGQNGKSGGSRTALMAPSVLPQDLDEDEGDDW
jgi:hypothetical protein